MPSPDPAAFLEILGVLTRSVRAAAAEAYAELGVGSAQAKFLRHIGDHRGASQAELARATATDPGLAGRALEGLIRRGWVRRTRSREDRRAFVLALSPAGERARARVEAARARVARRIVQGLAQRDVADFERVAEKIRGALV